MEYSEFPILNLPNLVLIMLEVGAHDKNCLRRAGSDPRPGSFGDGYDAFRQGAQFSDNPHQQDTSDHLAWEDGWCQARDDAAPRDIAADYCIDPHPAIRPRLR